MIGAGEQANVNIVELAATRGRYLAWNDKCAG
jgi:hypothetical protein